MPLEGALVVFQPVKNRTCSNRQRALLQNEETDRGRARPRRFDHVVGRVAAGFKLLSFGMLHLGGFLSGRNRLESLRLTFEWAEVYRAAGPPAGAGLNNL